MAHHIQQAAIKTASPLVHVALGGELPSSQTHSQAAAPAKTNPAPASYPYRLYHYTNRAGYDGIIKTQMIKASTVDGLKNTHYGHGIYLSGFGPTEIGIIGAHEFCTRLYSRCDAYAIDRVSYFFEISVDASPDVQRVDPLSLYAADDIWLVPGDEDLNIAGHMTGHGRTDLGHGLETMSAQDLAKAEKEEARIRKAPSTDSTKTPNQTPLRKKSDMVFIGGQSVKRPEDWDEDFYGHVHTFN